MIFVLIRPLTWYSKFSHWYFNSLENSGWNDWTELECKTRSEYNEIANVEKNNKQGFFSFSELKKHLVNSVVDCPPWDWQVVVSMPGQVAPKTVKTVHIANQLGTLYSELEYEGHILHTSECDNHWDFNYVFIMKLNNTINSLIIKL